MSDVDELKQFCILLLNKNRKEINKFKVEYEWISEDELGNELAYTKDAFIILIYFRRIFNHPFYTSLHLKYWKSWRQNFKSSYQRNKCLDYIFSPQFDEDLNNHARI